MKRLLLLLLCMLAYMPAAFASTWQEDVEAVTSHPEKVYEVYCGMPYEDFEQTWENVPNWSCKDKKPRRQVFEKIIEDTWFRRTGRKDVPGYDYALAHITNK